MSDVASELACLGDARLATHATSAGPAWLWSPDATRILWANPIGAAILGAPTPAALAARAFDPLGPLAAQIARITGSLHPGGQPRLERLRGFGGGFGRALTCACSRIALADRTPGILVIAAEPAGPTLALAERLRRLFADSGLAVAAFAPGGALLHATPQARLGAHTTLTALGAASIAADALAHGRAEGDSALGPITVERLGSDATTVLVATLTAARFAPEQAAAPRRDDPAGPPPPDVVAPPTVPVAPEAPETPPIAPDARAEAASPAPPAQRMDAAERRHPLRFVWQMDATGHFTLGSDGFTEVIGPTLAAALGRPWPEINAAFALDPEEQVARAVATHDTWSGITVSWPVDGCADRLKVELSGLPIFDRNRSFQGYRGFGVCRDIDRIATLTAMRRPPPPVTVPAAVAPPPEPAPTPPPAPDARPALTVVPAAANVVPFRGPSAADAKGLNPVERSAFHELARQLTARLKGDGEAATEEPSPLPAFAPAHAVASVAPRMVAAPEAAPPETDDPLPDAQVPTAQPLVLATSADHDPASETARGLAAAPAGELAAVLDAMVDGVFVIEPDGRIVAANRAAAVLFGYDLAELLARRFAELVAPASRTTALASLAPGASRDPIGPSDGGHEIIGQTRQGATLPLRMWLRPLADGARTCAILRDMTAAKQAERDAAREVAERAAAEKTETAAAANAAEQTTADKFEFVAKVSHELRTPLNSIVGFAEVMLAERFGPIGNERYRDYIKDIRASGEHAVALLNDLLLLVKIAAGQLDLDVMDVTLNDAVQACVAQMQPQANRERIIIRTSLAPHLPPVVADPGALRQIALNLLANAIRLTGPGGQVIVSTAPGAAGEAVLRVRDTGIGMDEKELAATLDPFRRSATASRWGETGTGLCLPLTRALAQANRARFTIASKVNDGTLVEVAFPTANGRAD